MRSGSSSLQPSTHDLPSPGQAYALDRVAYTAAALPQTGLAPIFEELAEEPAEASAVCELKGLTAEQIDIMEPEKLRGLLRKVAKARLETILNDMLKEHLKHFCVKLNVAKTAPTKADLVCRILDPDLYPKGTKNSPSAGERARKDNKNRDSQIRRDRILDEGSPALRAHVAEAKAKKPPSCGCAFGKLCSRGQSCDACDEGHRADGEEAANRLRVRFHASTNVCMTLPRKDEAMQQELMQRAAHVTSADKVKLFQQWGNPDGGHMFHGRPLGSCAACGIRDPSLEYSRLALDQLPDGYSNMDAVEPHYPDSVATARKRRDALRNSSCLLRERADSEATVEVHLSRLLSCYEHVESGTLYHLHPELVDPPDALNGAIEGHSVLFCEHCKRRADESKVGALSIAAGIDYGWLQRIPELEPLTELETLLLSEIRLYHVVVKVTTKYSATGRVLKGDVIYFPHDGPLDTVTTLAGRVDWLTGSDFRFLLIGPDGSHDNLEKWISSQSFIQVRPHVCYNHLLVRHRLDCALGNPSPAALPDFTEISGLLAGLDAKLAAKARVVTADSTVGAVEAMGQAERDDTASVRDPTGTISRVALVSSRGSSEDGTESMLRAVREATQGETQSADDPEDGADAPGDEAASPAPPVGRDASVPPAAAQPPTGVRRVSRMANPLNEFEGNGLNIMRLFRSTFPLGRFCYAPDPDDPGKSRVHSLPLDANGTIPGTRTRHLLLQFTTVAAYNAALIFVLANQRQRHATMQAVKAKVKHRAFDKFVEVVTADGFSDRLDRAIANPSSDDARRLHEQLLPLLALAGKERPWSRLERGAEIAEMLGFAERHGDACIFWTVSPDDVHQVISIRLAFSSKSNTGFPSFASGGERERSHADDLMEQLRSGSGQVGRARWTVADDGSYVLTTDVALSSLEEGQLQRLAAENPVATSMLYQELVDKVLEVLIGLANEKHRKKTDAILKCLQRPKEPVRGERRPGNFGIPVAHKWVTETSGRQALHMHGTLVTALSPKLLALKATDEDWMGKLADAIQSQCQAFVNWEVHAVHKAQRVLGVPKRRASFHLLPTESLTAANYEQHQNTLALTALQLGDHEFHSDTCHKPPMGCKGCRGGYRRPHPICRTRMLQVIPEDAPFCPDEEIDGGVPARCANGCALHWPGADGTADDELLPLRIIKPRPPPSALPGDLLPRDDRAIACELKRPTVDCPDEGLRGKIAASEALDDGDSIALVKEVLEHEPVRKLLRATGVSIDPSTLSGENARELLEAWRTMGCSNGDVVEFNEVLTGCTGSNTAPYHLGCSQFATVALFCEYMLPNRATERAASLQVNCQL